MGKSVARVTKSEAVPPLRDGDRLTRREFFRRYEADPTVSRAELIKGVVHVISRRVGANRREFGRSLNTDEDHPRTHFDIIGWLGVYSAYTPGTEGSAPTTVYAPSRNTAPEPDALLRILPEFGGQTATDADGFLHGAPELVTEVSNTNAAHDLGPKMEVYRDDGVREYLVWRTADAVIDWFVLRRKRYVALTPDANGWLRSETFPGLWLDVAALLAGDMATVLQVVQQGVASREHAAFVAKLRAAAGRRKRR